MIYERFPAYSVVELFYGDFHRTESFMRRGSFSWSRNFVAVYGIRRLITVRTAASHSFLFRALYLWRPCEALSQNSLERLLLTSSCLLVRASAGEHHDSKRKNFRKFRYLMVFLNKSLLTQYNYSYSQKIV